jgi:hypothetical protein
MRTPPQKEKLLYSDAPRLFWKWISEPSLRSTRNSSRVRVTVNYRERNTGTPGEREFSMKARLAARILVEVQECKN